MDNFYDSAMSEVTDGAFKGVCLSGIKTEGNDDGSDGDINDGVIEDGFLRIIVRPLTPFGGILPDPKFMTDVKTIQQTINLHASVFIATSDFEFKDTDIPKFGQILNCYFENGSISDSNFTGLRFSQPTGEQIDDDYKQLATTLGIKNLSDFFENTSPALVGVPSDFSAISEDNSFVFGGSEVGPDGVPNALRATAELTPEDKILFDLIALHESRGSYDAANVLWYPSGKGGGAFKIKADLNSSFEGAKISELSFGKIKELQATYFKVRYPTTKPPNSFFAMGKFQVIPKTMRMVRSGLGFSDSDIYSPTNQDLIIQFLIYSGKKRASLSAYLLNKGSVTLDQAQTDLSREFSSIPTPDGTSYYGNEKAHHESETIRTALKNARDANKKSGRTTMLNNAQLQSTISGFTGQPSPSPVPLADLQAKYAGKTMYIVPGEGGYTGTFVTEGSSFFFNYKDDDGVNRKLKVFK